MFRTSPPSTFWNNAPLGTASLNLKNGGSALKKLLEYRPTRRNRVEESRRSQTELPPGAEESLALEFAKRHGRDLRYVDTWGKWLYWDGKRWRPDETRYVLSLVRTVCRDAARAAEKPKDAAVIGRASTVSGVERLARADRRFAVTAEIWDADPWLLNTPRGPVDLRTGLLRPHRRDDFITKITAVGPGGACPIWRGFLRRIMNGDLALEEYLQVLIGYCLTGLTDESLFFFLFGTGANGKSVFIGTLLKILHDYAQTAPMDAFHLSPVERHPTELARLRGARFVSAVETEEGKRWNESLLKRVTGGERITARLMRQDYSEFTPQFKLLISGNHKPAIRTVDEGMRRRIHLVPFEVTIPAEERDKRLPEKLQAEWPGILAWAIEGAVRWAKEGLQPPAAVRDATDDYLASEDTFGRWLEQCCHFEAAATTTTTDLFAHWKEWCDEAGEHPGSQRRFVQRLRERRPDLERWKDSYSRRAGYRGIGLVLNVQTNGDADAL